MEFSGHSYGAREEVGVSSFSSFVTQLGTGILNYSPQFNRMLERFNSVLHQYLMKVVDKNQTDWDH